MTKNIGKKILLIENNPSYIQIFENALYQAGFQTKVAETASEGLRITNQFDPQLVLINYTLPDLSGKDLMLALQSNSYQNPIIIIADEINIAEAIQLMRLGASDVIIPPFRDTLIMSVVESALIKSEIVDHQKEKDLKIKTHIENLNYRINELSILHAIHKSFINLPNEDRIIEFMFRAISRFFEVSSSYLLVQNERKSFAIKHSIGLSNSIKATMIHELVKVPNVFQNLTSSPSLIKKNELEIYYLKDIGKTAISYPLIIDEQLTALFVFIRKSGENFTLSDQKLIEMIAEQALQEIKNKEMQKKINQKTQDIRYLEHRLQHILKESQKSNQKLTESILPNLAQNQILLFEFKENPENDEETIDSMIENLLDIEKNIKLNKLNNEFLHNLSVQEICLNNLLENMIRPYAPDNAIFNYTEGKNLYIQNKNQNLETLLEELLTISISHRAHKPILVKLENNQSEFAKISFINKNKIIDYEAMLMLFDSLYEKEIIPLPSAEEIEERKKTSTLKQIIYMEQGMIWAEKISPHGNSINLTIPLAADSSAKSNRAHSS